MANKKKSLSYGDTFKEWELITEACDSNQGDFPYLQAPKEELEALLEQVKDAVKQQAAYTASRQNMSSKISETLEKGRKLATVLRTAIKQRYGNRSEKLVEFGVQPLRPRRQSVSTAPPPGPEAPAPDPTSQG
jgi:hypothetical protein